MSYPISVNFKIIENICKKLSTPEQFVPNKDSYNRLMASFTRAVGFRKEVESFEFDDWLMIGNYKYFVSLQPHFEQKTKKNEDLFNRIRKEAFQSVVALINLPIEFTNLKVRLTFAISHIAGLDKKDNLISISTPEGVKPLNETVFFAEADNYEDLESLIDNFISGIDSKSLSKGFYEKPENFRGFSYYRAKEKMEDISSDYKNYKNYKLMDIAEIKKIKTGEVYEDIKNSVYIPSVGNSECRDSLDTLSMKHQNYFQVKVNNKYGSNRYISNYLNSPIGKLERESLIGGITIKFISKNNLEKLIIPIPDKKVQDNINAIHSRLKSIKDSINEFEESILLNPTSESDIKNQLDNIADILGDLSAAERIDALIAGGESKTVEFKETYSLDINTKTKEERLTLASLKNIAGFLNSDGGNLLIGISDDGEIKGINNEIEKFDQGLVDKFLLRLKNNLKKYFGESIYPLIDQNIININDKKVLQIECLATRDPIFMSINKVDYFYVRTNPATDSLTGKKQYEYIENRKKAFVSISKDD